MRPYKPRSCVAGGVARKSVKYRFKFATLFFGNGGSCWIAEKCSGAINNKHSSYNNIHTLLTYEYLELSFLNTIFQKACWLERHLSRIFMYMYGKYNYTCIRCNLMILSLSLLQNNFDLTFLIALFLSNAKLNIALVYPSWMRYICMIWSTM
jgi:hypothetical protein